MTNKRKSFLKMFAFAAFCLFAAAFGLFAQGVFSASTAYAATCTHHTNVDETTFKCRDCGTSGLIVKLTIDGTVKGYYNRFFDELYAELPADTSSSNAVVTFLDDGCRFLGVRFENKKFTIDFNGKNVLKTSNSIVKKSIVVFKDSVGGGGVDFEYVSLVGFQFSYSTVTIESGRFYNSGTGTAGMSLDYGTTTMNGGSIESSVACAGSASSPATFEMNGGSIAELYRNNGSSYTFNNGRIDKFTNFSPNNYKAALGENKAYSLTGSGTLIKLTNMKSNTASVTIADCTHDSYANGECEYCGKACVHPSLDSNNKCTVCGKTIAAAAVVTTGSNTAHYTDIGTAIAALTSGSTIKLLKDVGNETSTEISVGNVTVDLNGKSLLSLQVKSKVKFIDTSSATNERELGFYLHSSADVTLELNDKVKCVPTVFGTLKIYGARIVYYNASKALRTVLPESYALRFHDDSGSSLVEWNDAKATTVLFNDTTKKTYYTVEKCTHDKYDDDLKCVYCNATVSAGVAITAVKSRLETAVSDLETAISVKANAGDLTTAIANLDAAYKEADRVLKSGLDSKDAELAGKISDLETAYKAADNALQTAINTVQTNLDNAVNNLETKINTKADSTALSQAIEDLTAAYKAADALLKTDYQTKDAELEGKISDLETAYKAADNALQTAINTVQTNLDNAVNNLQTKINTKASSTELSQAIADLTAAYEAADAILKTEFQTKDTELENKINNLQAACADTDAALQRAVDKVQANLDRAVKSLTDSIAKNKDDVEKKLSELDKAYKAADAIINSDVSMLKVKDTELAGRIDDLEKAYKAADEAVLEGLKKLQENLDEVKRQLEAKDKELEERLNSLQKGNDDNTVTFLIISAILGAAIIALIIVQIVKSGKNKSRE